MISCRMNSFFFCKKNRKTAPPLPFESRFFKNHFFFKIAPIRNESASPIIVQVIYFEKGKKKKENGTGLLLELYDVLIFHSGNKCPYYCPDFEAFPLPKQKTVPWKLSTKYSSGEG